MENLVECNRFSGRPVVSASEFALYFNLEYGLEFEETEDNKYCESDFEFNGFFLSSDNQEQMYWDVKNKQDLWGVALPLENGNYMIFMTDVSPKNLPAIGVG